jgi:hypothetical protein
MENATNTRLPLPVVMFHVGRSGSRVVGDLLDQQASVTWEGEIYRKALAYQRKGIPAKAKGEWPVDPEGLLVARQREHHKEYYGFEVKFQHLERFKIGVPDFLQLLERHGCRHFVVLRRENLLRKVISSRVGSAIGRFHLTETPEVPTRVWIDPNRTKVDGVARPLIEALEMFDRQLAELDSLLEGRRHLALTYERDVASDPRVAARKICGFLGIPEGPMEVRYAKTNPWPLRQVIENYGEVRDCLRGTRFEWMLEETGPA